MLRKAMLLCRHVQTASQPEKRCLLDTGQQAREAGIIPPRDGKRGKPSALKSKKLKFDTKNKYHNQGYTSYVCSSLERLSALVDQQTVKGTVL